VKLFEHPGDLSLTDALKAIREYVPGGRPGDPKDTLEEAFNLSAKEYQKKRAALDKKRPAAGLAAEENPSVRSFVTGQVKSLCRQVRRQAGRLQVDGLDAAELAIILIEQLGKCLTADKVFTEA
jgi:hypothetical protein